MFLGRVIGTVLATCKIDGLVGIRLLVVQPVCEEGKDRGGIIVAADTTQAGPGEVVHVTSSREAAVAMPNTFVPVDHAIIALVDRVGREPLQVATQWPAPAVKVAKTPAKRPSKRKSARRSVQKA